MKTRFSTIDIVAIVTEIQKCIGMRVNQVYDVDNKNYLIRLNRYEEKVILLMESGLRIHTTEFDWPKNPSPSGFSMKLRKHIKNKRLESINQLGSDRIIDLQFGINDAAYHIILELYDKGNIVLTDFEYTILYILRPRSSGSEDVKFIVREKYPVERARASVKSFERDEIYNALKNAKEGDALKKILMPLVVFGPALLDHVLLKNGFPKNCLINKHFNVSADINRLYLCLEEADVLMKDIEKNPEGYLMQKVENNKDGNEVVTNVEFHPYLFHQFKDMRFMKYPSFDRAVDNYFSSMEGQKIDLKAFQKEKEALKKLENVKKDHEQRLLKLHESQAEDIKKAQLIEMNLGLVEKAILVIRSAIANQISWSDIQDLIKEAQFEGDPVAIAIKKLKLDINHFTLLLSNPHTDSEDESGHLKPQLVDIDLDYSAYANARKYYDMKRAHAKKEQKTIESSEKAFKNAEKKTKQALKEVAVTTTITKSRKVMWFEKFIWFISSENYLVIAGRDVQQNELIVKRHMKANDVYVHADLHGASSLVIKNPNSTPIPPKTLNEAGTMAVCNSSAWDAKIVTSAWWVYSNQVSKTAPSGEYLTTGSFMIRGKKNYLAPAHLIMGFGFMFKLDDESYQNHLNERCERSEESKFEMDEAIKSVENVSENEESEQSDSDNSSCKDETETMKESDMLGNVEKADSLEGDASEDALNVENTVSFPDTEVKLNVLSEIPNTDKPDEKVSISHNSTGVVIQQHKKKVPKISDNVEQRIQNNSTKEKQSAPKRGQRGKMKKIKEKYKYQDEEERELRMKILASAGQAKEEKKNKNKKSNPHPKVNQTKNPKRNLHFIEISEESTILEVKNIAEEKCDLPVSDLKTVPEPASDLKTDVPEPVSDDELEDEAPTGELQLLNFLTGCPVPDDTLLYAVPVCAPYNTMLPYKYKVKIIPGSSRRGKAAKTALQIFMHEKNATQRERDLLRSVKDQDISRNLPGKIKISTANFKKK